MLELRDDADLFLAAPSNRFKNAPDVLRSPVRPHSQGPFFESEHLSRVVGEKILVNEITVQVQGGEVLAVVGHSGAGKTSFLRLLNRLDEPTSGTIRFNGRDYRESGPRELRRRIGMVMQTARGWISRQVSFACAA